MTPQEEFLKQLDDKQKCICGHFKNDHSGSDEHCDKCQCEEYCEPARPYWQCQECGYENKLKPMPKMSPYEWYGRRKPEKCPRCKSEAFQPVGW